MLMSCYMYVYLFVCLDQTNELTHMGQERIPWFDPQFWVRHGFCQQHFLEVSSTNTNIDIENLPCVDRFLRFSRGFLGVFLTYVGFPRAGCENSATGSEDSGHCRLFCAGRPSRFKMGPGWWKLLFSKGTTRQ